MLRKQILVIFAFLVSFICLSQDKECSCEAFTVSEENSKKVIELGEAIETSFNEDISEWSVSQVTSLRGTFFGAKAYKDSKVIFLRH